MSRTESNAALFCGWIKSGFRKGFIIEWKNSSSWGYCPHIYCDATIEPRRDCVRVYGCDYNKKSSALAEFLCHLFDDDDTAKKDVQATAGGGFREVAAALARHGWILEEVATGAYANAYTIKRA